MTLVASHSPDRSTPLRRSSAVERIRERIIAGWRLGACVRVEDFAEEMFAAGATEDDWHELILTEIRRGAIVATLRTNLNTPADSRNMRRACANSSTRP